MWLAHTEWGVTIADSQSEWTPLQKHFLALGHQEYGASNDDVPNANVPSKYK